MECSFIRKSFYSFTMVSIFLFTPLCADPTEEKLKDKSKAIELNNEGIGLLRKNEVLDARSKFENATKLDTESPEYPNNVGFTYLLLNDEEKAEIYFSKALEIEPDFFRANYNLGVLYQKKANVKRAIEYYKKSVEKNPNFPEARYNLALMYVRSGEKKLAIESFEKFIEIASPEMKQPVIDAKQRISELRK
ncbi:tetratricopeptide repeat protein [Leptospira jelokensis]|nr:tetratricopeptide repeat protein [Leptospira jelokensis]